MIGIAIVDDDRCMLETAKQILWDIAGDYGDVRIDGFQRASEFLDALSRHRYQILISDIDMPEINGIELCEKTREKYPGIYIVFLTAYVEYAIDSYRMDAYQYILKSEIQNRFPAVMGKLVEIVANSQINYCYVGIGSHLYGLYLFLSLCMQAQASFCWFHCFQVQPVCPQLSL